MGAICLGLSLLCLTAPLELTAQEKGATAPWLEMPDDPVGRLWASVGDDVQPWNPPQAGAAGADLTWENWSKALKVLTSVSEGATFYEPDQSARRAATAFLVRFAVEDRRAEDAFRWLRGVGADDPEALAGLLPTLFPGVPAETKLLPGGRIPALSADVVLRPQLPPEPRAAARRGLSRRSTCRGLVIGGATLDLTMKLDGSGVVAEFTHRGGPAVTLVVVLPAPKGKRLKSLYVDWDIQEIPQGRDESSFDWAETPIQITLQPQPTGEDSPGYAESFSIFARLDFLKGGIPSSPSAALPTALSLGGLDLWIGPPPPTGEDMEPWGQISSAWAEAASIPVHVITPAQAEARRAAARSSQLDSPQDAPPSSLQGTAVHFDRAPDPSLLRRQITGAIEERRRQAHLLYR